MFFDPFLLLKQQPLIFIKLVVLLIVCIHLRYLMDIHNLSVRVDQISKCTYTCT